MIVTARLTFSAAHRLHNPNRDAAWNRETYDKCDNPKGHGHNYALEVSVRGRIDPETGMVIDLKKLKDIPAGATVLGFNYDTGERYLSVEGFLPAN